MRTIKKNFASEKEAVKYWNAQSNKMPRPVKNEMEYNKDGTYTVETTWKE